MARKRPARRKRPSEGTSRARNTKSGFREATVPTRLSERSKAARDRALHALAAMRRDPKLTITEAAKLYNVSSRTMRSRLPLAFDQDRAGGRIRPTPSDHELRQLQIPGPNGPIEVNANGSKEASELAAYKSAVNRFLRGERNALAPWHGKKIGGVELVTSSYKLKSLATSKPPCGHT
jgi:hypothetical protein